MIDPAFTDRFAIRYNKPCQRGLCVSWDKLSRECRPCSARILDHISLESVRATWEAGLYLYRTDFPVQLDAKVAFWYGEKEAHMKKAIQKLRKVYPKLTVRCFSDFGHGDIINHPELFVEEMT